MRARDGTFAYIIIEHITRHLKCRICDTLETVIFIQHTNNGRQVSKNLVGWHRRSERIWLTYLRKQWLMKLREKLRSDAQIRELWEGTHRSEAILTRLQADKRSCIRVLEEKRKAIGNYMASVAGQDIWSYTVRVSISHVTGDSKFVVCYKIASFYYFFLYAFVLPASCPFTTNLSTIFYTTFFCARSRYPNIQTEAEYALL